MSSPPRGKSDKRNRNAGSPGSTGSPNKKGSTRSSLVILTNQNEETSFQKRAFNPDEYINLSPKYFGINTGHNESDDVMEEEIAEEETIEFAKQENNIDDIEFPDEDACSVVSSSALPLAKTPEKIRDKMQNQLNVEQFGLNFANQFMSMTNENQAQLGLFAQFETCKKKNWINNLWNLYDPQEKEDNETRESQLLYSLLVFNYINSGKECPFDISQINQDPYATCLNKAAKDTLEKFIFSDEGGLNLFMRGAIMGPVGSGKSLYLHFLFSRILNFLIESGKFKDYFIIPLDFQNAQITSVESFYQYMSRKIIEALLIQRPDLQLFEHALKKSFSTLTKVQKIKHFPKPTNTQQHLCLPIKQVENLLIRMHQCYHDPSLTDSFLTNVVLLPQLLGSIFFFKSPLFIIDHIDDADIEFKRKGSSSIQLLEFLKFGLSNSQYLISCRDGESLADKLNAIDDDSIDLRNQTQNIYVYDIFLSNYENSSILVTFDDKAVQKNLILSPSHCGGCPSFIGKFDKLCDLLEQMNQTSGPRKKEIKVRLLNQVKQYIKDMYDFDELPIVRNIEFAKHNKYAQPVD